MTISVNVYRNPLQPAKREQFCAKRPVTLRQITIDSNGGAIEWPFPTVAIVNGEPWKRGRWNEPLSDGMVVEFRSMLRGGGGRTSTIGGITAVATLGLSTGLIPIGMGLQAIGTMMQQAGIGGGERVSNLGTKFQQFGSAGKLGGLPDVPQMPSALDGELGSPTYNFDGRGNRKRNGEPIPVIYGMMRVFPDLTQDLYTTYGSDDSQTLNFVGVIGQGEYELYETDGRPNFGNSKATTGSDFYVTTDLSALSSGGTFHYCIHFDDITGDIITTSTKAGTSRSKYSGVGIYQFIEWDIEYQGGLFDATSGSIAARSNDFTVYAYEYRDNGAYFAWSIGTAGYNVNVGQRGAVRRTISMDCSGHTFSTGRALEVRIKRNVAESTSLNIIEQARFTGARAKLTLPTPSGQTYVAFKLKASESLNGDAASKFSIQVTRKLPIYDSGTETWSAPTATRSIAWALADILRNADYGMGLDDAYIDLDALVALDAVWTARGDYFDGVFDQTITAWEALQKVARCGRAIPVLVNGKVTFVRDGVKSVRSAIFNQSNMLPGSLSIEYSFRQYNEPDGIDLTYINTQTWQQAHVIVAIPGVIGDPSNAQKVDLFGCTDSAQATREATYLARRMAYMRKVISWQTEMDGRLLMVGDMVAISHDVPSWSQSGEVVGFTDNGATCDYLSSQPLDWSAVGTKYVLLKKQDGSVSGPHTATEITGGFRINDPAWVPNSTLENGDRTTFIFYVGTVMDVVITEISPAGDTVCNITAVPYDSRIHDTGA